jgi:ubiquinone/menaquinone biosynthesis C-methylase UbiE
MDNTSQFNSRAKKYTVGRASYPIEICEDLLSILGLDCDCSVADVGAGTGKLTAILAKRFSHVYAIEPNKEMFTELKGQVLTCSNVSVLNGSAEQTSLENSSVDIVCAAQAFHWFNPVLAKAEFLRVLNGKGGIAIIRNVKDLRDEGMFEYDKLIKDTFPAYLESPHQKLSDSVLEEFVAPCPLHFRHYSNYQVLNWESFTARLDSLSYIPMSGGERDRFNTCMRNIFDKYSKNEKFTMRYVTEMHVAKIS